jgi:prepilin signal peptidase PulO-like enzyme (type II secretory pathway)
MELHGVGLLRFGFWLFYLVIFLALTISDLRWFLLPDKLVAVLTGATVVELGVRILFFGASWHAAAWAGAGALLVSGLFYILFQVSKGKWIGGGDVKLGVSLGLLAGNPINALLLLFIASATGTVAVLPMILAGQAKKKTVIPFGPLLIFGLIFVRLWGKVVIDWYARLL